MSKLFIKCKNCETTHFISFLKRAHYVCSKCNYHFRLNARRRIKMLCDKGSFKEMDKNIESSDPLMFPKYKEKLDRSKGVTKEKEAILTGEAKIGGYRTTFGAMEPSFIMASMGSAAGEKITKMLEYSIEENIPAIIVVCSGGARMQEGILSLMQMAKTSAAVKRLNNANLPLITVLTDPTTGGVTASFAMLANIIIAEQNALIGFAGPRVIRQTIGQKLPSGFQRSQFLLEHGMLDMVVTRKRLKNTLSKILKIHSKRPYFSERGI